MATLLETDLILSFAVVMTLRAGILSVLGGAGVSEKYNHEQRERRQQSPVSFLRHVLLRKVNRRG